MLSWLQEAPDAKAIALLNQAKGGWSEWRERFRTGW